MHVYCIYINYIINILYIPTLYIYVYIDLSTYINHMCIYYIYQHYDLFAFYTTIRCVIVLNDAPLGINWGGGIMDPCETLQYYGNII